MKKLLLVLALLVALPLAVLAQDEPTNLFDEDAFSSLMERASGVVERKQASSKA